MKYQFINPGRIKVNKRTNEDCSTIDLKGDLWEWSDGGNTYRINWEKLYLHSELKDIAKGYIRHRLQTKSLGAVHGNDYTVFTTINNVIGKQYPLELKHINLIVDHLIKKNLNLLFSFISFYKWCLNNDIDNFSLNLLEKIRNANYTKRQPYAKALLYPNYLTPEDEIKITEFIHNNYREKKFKKLRNTLLLNISLELGLRPIQIYCIDLDDCSAIDGPSNAVSYFSLNIQMAKKISNTTFEKKTRSISVKLGLQINRLKKFISNINQPGISNGLFLKRSIRGDYKRLSSKEIGKIINDELLKLGFKGGAYLLRHHLAQSLADQGTPADIIAEILGHNSTVPARAYISATPEIAAIKPKALGKSEVYRNIMNMLLTGEIIEKSGANKSTWVKGMIGSQYIGGIGSCGLAENTSCPKNPVYSCYTCNKFHPFIDGNHEEVKINLQRQAQFNVDIANASMDLEYNRPATQLETTIIAVNTVIEKCNSLLPKDQKHEY